MKKIKLIAELGEEGWDIDFDTKGCELLDVGDIFVACLSDICSKNNHNVREFLEYLASGQEAEIEDKDVLEALDVEVVE